MKVIKLHALFLLLIILNGCQAIGVPPADSFNAKVAVAYATVTEVRNTAATLLVAKKISGDEATKVLSGTDITRAGIDTARIMYATDKTQAERNLDIIRAGLVTLSSYLASKQ